MKKIEAKTDDQGRPLFRLVIRLRSKANPTIRPRKHSEWFFTEKEAWNQERKLVQSIDRDIAKSEQEGCSWGYAVDKWEQALIDGRGVGRQITIATVENYTHGLRTHTKDWWKVPANQISRADIRDLYIRLDQDGHSRSMQQKMRSAFNGIFNWAIDTRLVRGIYQSPAQGVSLIGRKEDSVPEILTANEIRKLLKCAMDLNHPWYSIWAVAVFTGMRQGELHALEWSDIDFDNKLIYVHKSYDTKTRKVNPTTKGGWWRHIDMSSELETLLIELRATSEGRNWVLPRFKEWDKGYQAKILRTFCQGIGIPSVKFHTLRACFATLLMQDGVAPAIVMAMGGWKDQETMAIYIRHAGIDIKGATAGLKLLPTKEVMGRVVELFKPK
ncbi:MAG: site-specific integrase [Pseudomonadota bacterium]|nr:site-specific integrase [Pseudomonadota bacterium]